MSANGAARLGHRRQDVVRRAVDDAPQRLDAIAGEPLAQHADDRDAAAHRGLVVDVDAGAPRRREHLGAVLGEQRLVRGDDVLAGRDRREHRALAPASCRRSARTRCRRRVARIAAIDVGREQRAIDLDDALGLVRIAHRDRADLDARAEPGLDRLRVVREQLDDAAADVAEAEQSDTDRASSS